MKQLIETSLFSYLMADRETVQAQDVHESIESFAEKISVICDSVEPSLAFRTLNFTRIQLLTLREKYLNEPIKAGGKCSR